MSPTRSPTWLFLSATAVGSPANIDIDSSGNIALGSLTALGDEVTLTAGGAITDGNGAAVNVTAHKLTITGPGGIAGLDLAVDSLTASGVNPGAVLTNANPLALDATSLATGGTFSAPSITILDMPTDLTVVTPGASVLLTTVAGNIIFLDQNDTIQTSGAGTITVQAGTAPGSVLGNDAVAIIGNLKTQNQPISVSADSHISIGLLDAGNAKVTVDSKRGLILDGNGPA